MKYFTNIVVIYVQKHYPAQGKVLLLVLLDSSYNPITITESQLWQIVFVHMHSFTWYFKNIKICCSSSLPELLKLLLNYFTEHSVSFGTDRILWMHWDGDVDGLAYRGLYIYQLLFPFFVESYIFFLPQMQRFCEWLLVLVQLAMC